MRKLTRMATVFSILMLAPVFLVGCSKMRMARHESRGERYFEAGDFSKAEVEYLNCLHLTPGDARAITRLGMIYYEQGRFSRAYTFLSKASELSPNDLNVRVELGTIYLGSRKTKEAREQASFVIDRSRTNSEAIVLLAEAADSREEADKARKRLESLSKEIGDTAPLELAYGVLETKRGDYKSAELSIKRSITLDGTSSAAYFALGSLYAAQNDTKNADAALKMAADLAPVHSIRRLSYATFKVQTGNLIEGKQLLAEISKQTPDYVPAWIQRAEIAFAEKKFQDCSSLLDEVLGRDPENYQAMLLQGRLYLVQNLPDKAISVLEHSVAVYNSSPQFRYYLGMAFLMKNKLPEAADSFTKALSETADFPEATLALAQVNIQRGNLDTAVTSLKQFVKQRPKLPQGYLLLASAYMDPRNPDQQKLDKAIAIYSQLGEIDPTNAAVPVLMGAILLQQKKNADARSAFEHALKFSPHLFPAVEGLVDTDIADKRFSAAVECISEQLGTNSTAPESHMLLAKVYTARALDASRKDTKSSLPLAAADAQPDVNQAEAELLKAIDLNPNFQAPYFTLAQLYVSAGKRQAALDRLNALIARTNSAVAYFQIGAIQEAATNYAAARDAYEMAIKRAPEMNLALNNLAYLYSEFLGDIDKALADAQKARELMPEDPSTADTLGWILYKKGDYARALPLLTESATKMVAEPEVRFHLGMTQYMLGNEEAARSALEGAAQSTKEFPGKEQARQRLAVLAVNVKATDPKTIGDLETNFADHPNDPIVASRLAAIYQRDGKFQKAASTYEQVLKLNPQNPFAMSQLAQLYATLKDQKKALEMAKQAHIVAPNDGLISALLGRLVYANGDYNWAASLLQDAVRQYPNQPDLLYDAAWANYAIGRVSEAESIMQGIHASLSGPKLEDAGHFLDMISAAKSTVVAKQSLAQANQILVSDPNYVPALMVLGVQQQGQLKDAAKTYEKVLEHFPTFTPAMRNLAIIYAQDPAQAQKAYELASKVRTAMPDDAEISRTLGILAYRRGDYNRSVQLLSQNVQMLNGDGEMLYYLGMARYQLNQKQESKDALQRALALNLKTNLSDGARKVLAELNNAH
jgi:tetratricopeptide (TPR) repeat protein